MEEAAINSSVPSDHDDGGRRLEGKEEGESSIPHAAAVSPGSTPSASPAKTMDQETATRNDNEAEQQQKYDDGRAPKSPRILKNLKQFSSKMLDNLSPSPKTARKRALEEEMEEKMKLVMNHLNINEEEIQQAANEKSFRFSVQDNKNDSTRIPETPILREAENEYDVSPPSINATTRQDALQVADNMEMSTNDDDVPCDAPVSEEAAVAAPITTNIEDSTRNPRLPEEEVPDSTQVGGIQVPGKTAKESEESNQLDNSGTNQTVVAKKDPSTVEMTSDEGSLAKDAPAPADDETSLKAEEIVESDEIVAELSEAVHVVPVNEDDEEESAQEGATKTEEMKRRVSESKLSEASTSSPHLSPTGVEKNEVDESNSVDSESQTKLQEESAPPLISVDRVDEATFSTTQQPTEHGSNTGIGNVQSEAERDLEKVPPSTNENESVDSKHQATETGQPEESNQNAPFIEIAISEEEQNVSRSSFDEEELKGETEANLAGMKPDSALMSSAHSSGSYRFYSDKGIQEPAQTANVFSAPGEASEERLVQETVPEASGSFRFYSDKGIQEPETDHINLSHDKLSEEIKQEIAMAHASGLFRLDSDEGIPEPKPDYLTTSARETMKDKRVSSRLLLAQGIELVPVNHSRGSEISSRVASYEEMKLHLNLMVDAATDYLQSTLHLEEMRSQLFQNLAEFADGTPLGETVGTRTSTHLGKKGGVGALSKTATRKYHQEILRHAEEWRDTVSSQVDEYLSEYNRLECEYFHYNSKTAKLRRRVRSADSWNLQIIFNSLSAKLARNEAKMGTAMEKQREKANKVCFLLDQVTHHGWKDLYPLVESTIEWELDRVHMEEETIAVECHSNVGELKAKLNTLEEEETTGSPRSFHGTSENVDDADAPTLRIDPSKPTLFLDDACPFTARVWITLLEKEADPFHPTGFHVIPVCSSNSQDPGMRLLKSLGMSASPVLVHNGNIFSESSRVAEYIDRAIHHPLYHSIPPLQPNSPTDVFNMKVFLKRHSKISEVFYNLMDSDDETARPQLAKELFDILGLIDEDLRKFPGPYFCGKQFTLADVSIFPFVEHIQIILDSFGGTRIPESLTFLLEWFDIVSRRPSIQLVTSDRTEESMQRNSLLKSTKRGDYLIEYHQHRCDHAERSRRASF